MLKYRAHYGAKNCNGDNTLQLWPVRLAHIYVIYCYFLYDLGQTASFGWFAKIGMFGKTNIANHQLALRTIININYHKPSSSSLWSSKSSTSMISDQAQPPIRPWQWASRSKPQEQTWFSWKKREKSANLDLIYPNQHLSSGFLFESST